MRTILHPSIAPYPGERLQHTSLGLPDTIDRKDREENRASHRYHHEVDSDVSRDSVEDDSRICEYQWMESVKNALGDYVAPTTHDAPPLYVRSTGESRYDGPDVAELSCQDDGDPAADSESDEAVDEEILQVQCWVPGKGLDAMVLSVYMEYFVDCTAVIGQSRSPDDSSKTGFAINAQAAMGIGELKDILKDSESWVAKMTGREYRENPYPYLESDTWVRRLEAGPTVNHNFLAPRQRKIAVVSEPLISVRPATPPHDRYRICRYTYF